MWVNRSTKFSIVLDPGQSCPLLLFEKNFEASGIEPVLFAIYCIAVQEESPLIPDMTALLSVVHVLEPPVAVDAP